MNEIIPNLLVQDEKKFESWLRTAEQFAQTIQIDILDNSFVPFGSWADPEVVETWSTPVDYQLHLMVDDVERHLNAWTTVRNVKAAIFHIEPFLSPQHDSTTARQHDAKVADVHDLLGTIAFYGWEPGLAINPETPLEVLEPFVKKISIAQFMSVAPGQSGQSFQKSVIDKIKTFRAQYPQITISVDGGVNAKTIPALAAAGAEQFQVTSAIYKADDPKEAYANLLKLL